MKKLLLPFVTLCIALNFCTAQTAYESLLLNSPGDFFGADDQAIVRMCNDRYAVAYRTKYDTGGSHSYFCLIDYRDFDISGILFPLYYVDYEQDGVMQGLEIKDMRVLGNFVAFCGRKITSTGNHGVIGYFKWTSFLNGQQVYIVYDTIQDLRSVNKMVFYIDSIAHNKIVAIGSSDNGYTCDYIIVKDDLSSSTYDKAYTLHRMSDIIETRNYVAFFIPRSLNDNYIYIRRTYKNNIFGSTLSQLYQYNSSGEANNLLHAIPLDGDSVAVAYVQNSVNYYSTRLRMVNLVNMINFNSQDYICDEKYEPYEMVYFPGNKSLVLLHDEKVSNGDVNFFVYFKPYLTTTYTSNKLIHPDLFFKTISLYQKKYISATGEKWYIHNFPSPIQADMECPFPKEINVSIVEPHAFIQESDTINPIPDDSPTSSANLSPDSEYQGIICHFGGISNLNQERGEAR